MPITSERARTTIKTEATIVKPSVAASQEGEIRYANGSWSLYDSAGAFDPRAGGALPSASSIGQVLLSIDGSSFTTQTPLVGDGWLANSDGRMLVVG